MDADLYCTEESFPELFQDADAMLSVPIVTIDPAEALDMLLQQETREGRVQRNPQYLTAVQSHGMKAHWRHVICKWMFEVRETYVCQLCVQSSR